MDSPVFLKEYTYLFLLTTALASGIAPETFNFGTIDNIVIQNTLVNPPNREKRVFKSELFQGFGRDFRAEFVAPEKGLPRSVGGRIEVEL
jgi:hypothetical protein